MKPATLIQRTKDERDLRICQMIDEGLPYSKIQQAEDVSPCTVRNLVKALQEIDKEN